MDRAPRLTSVMGVARALLATVDVVETVEVLIAEFGWDIAFQALALLRGDDAQEAFGLAWEHLVFDVSATDVQQLFGDPVAERRAEP